MTAIEKTEVRARRRTVLVSMAAMLCAACAGTAFAGPDLVDLRVVDRETGQVLRTYAHDGKLYVAGEPGARYGLRVRNQTSGRVMVVMSVDGVNIVTGETANFNQNGYVLEPGISYDLDGWRKSRTEIAAFEFAPQDQSYAARTGRPADVGVIGMAVFRERRVFRPLVYGAPPVQSYRRAEGRDRGASAAGALAVPAPPPPASAASPSAKASPLGGFESRSADAARDQARAYADIYPPAPREEKLGTAHGAREWSYSDLTDFVRATRYPQSVRRIEYDTWANLAAAGVIGPSSYGWRGPRPFPANPEPGFVPDPPDER